MVGAPRYILRPCATSPPLGLRAAFPNRNLVPLEVSLYEGK